MAPLRLKLASCSYKSPQNRFPPIRWNAQVPIRCHHDPLGLLFRQSPTPPHRDLPEKQGRDDAHSPIENVQGQRRDCLIKKNVQYTPNTFCRSILIDGLPTEPSLDEVQDTRNARHLLEQDDKYCGQVSQPKPRISNPRPITLEADNDGDCAKQYEKEIANVYCSNEIGGSSKKTVQLRYAERGRDAPIRPSITLNLRLTLLLEGLLP